VSIALMTSAWKLPIPAGRKMVLLALCDNANDQGECYPSVSMLTEKCSMSERSIQGHISDLEKDGLLVRDLRSGRSTMYRLNPRRICTPAEFAPPQNLHPTPAESAPPPPQNLHPTPAESAPITVSEPSIEPKEEKQRQRATSPRFDAQAHLLTLGVSESVARDWLTHRKTQKAAPTETAINALQAESAKADMPLEDVLALCCQRGWRGFKAEWVRDKPVASAPAGGPRPGSYHDMMTNAAATIYGTQKRSPA
jgi:DNA-binding transcriptional ArsR family regulator